MRCTNSVTCSDAIVLEAWMTSCSLAVMQALDCAHMPLASTDWLKWLVQDAVTQAQLQQQHAAGTHAAATAASEGRIQQLSSEVQQQQAQLDSLQEHLQSAHQQRDAAQSQLKAWQVQHAQQAPQIAELLNERQAWIQELQQERAAASAAAATAEVRC